MKRTILSFIFWVSIFVVGSLIVSFILEPSSLTNVKDKLTSKVSAINNLAPIKNNVTNIDPLISSCIQEFNNCAYRTNDKYGASVILKDAQKFSSKDTAEEYYNNWKGYAQIYYATELGFSHIKFPAVLIYAKIINQGEQSPIVVMCDEDGLSQYYKSMLLC